MKQRLGTFLINLSVTLCAAGMMLCGYAPSAIAALWERAHKPATQEPTETPMTADEVEGLRRAYWLATQNPRMH